MEEGKGRRCDPILDLIHRSPSVTIFLLSKYRPCLSAYLPLSSPEERFCNGEMSHYALFNDCKMLPHLIRIVRPSKDFITADVFA